MNENEKIAARLAEFAAKLDLKGHTKLAEEVDDLALKTIASASDWLQNIRDEFQAKPPMMGSNHSEESAPEEFQKFNTGLPIDSADGSETLTFSSRGQIDQYLKNGKISVASVVKGIEEALFKNKAPDSLAKIKAAAFGDKYQVALGLAKNHNLIK